MIESCVTTAETVDIGRARNGQFAKGNKFAVGNPFTKRVANLRRVLVETVSEQDIADVIASLIISAKQGDTAAAKLVLLYTVGHPQTFESPDHKISPHLIENQIDVLMNEFKAQSLLTKSFGQIPIGMEVRQAMKNRFMQALQVSEV